MLNQFDTFIYRTSDNMVCVDLMYAGHYMSSIVFGSEGAYRKFALAIFEDVEANSDTKNWSDEMKVVINRILRDSEL